MKHSIAHDLDESLAKKAAERAFAAYAVKLADYAPVVTWTDAAHANITFNVKGMTLKGRFTLAPGSIDLELDVPFLLRMFQGKAINVIDREVREWLVKAKAGEL